MGAIDVQEEGEYHRVLAEKRGASQHMQDVRADKRSERKARRKRSEEEQKRGGQGTGGEGENLEFSSGSSRKRLTSDRSGNGGRVQGISVHSSGGKSKEGTRGSDNPALHPSNAGPQSGGILPDEGAPKGKGAGICGQWWYPSLVLRNESRGGLADDVAMEVDADGSNVGSDQCGSSSEDRAGVKSASVGSGSGNAESAVGTGSGTGSGTQSQSQSQPSAGHSRSSTSQVATSTATRFVFCPGSPSLFFFHGSGFVLCRWSLSFVRILSVLLYVGGECLIPLNSGFCHSCRGWSQWDWGW